MFFLESHLLNHAWGGPVVFVFEIAPGGGAVICLFRDVKKEDTRTPRRDFNRKKHTHTHTHTHTHSPEALI